DRRRRLPPADALALLVRNLLLCREPLYGVGAWASRYEPSLLGLSPEAGSGLNDDRVGRALDDLFDADRPSLVLAVVVRAVREFDLRLTRFHNDSTTVTFHGAYRRADGRLVRGKPTLRITFGHNKDHRPDLKQLLWSLTVSADGAVPVNYQVLDGNTTDDQTHVATWDVLRTIAERADFLYVADSKLCTRRNMRHIAEHGGRFLTVLPRTRKEDKRLKDFMQTHPIPWQEVLRRAHPLGKRHPPDVFGAYEDPSGSSEGYRIVWYHSTEKENRDRQEREERIDRAIRQLQQLRDRLASPRTRLRRRDKVDEAIEAIMEESGASRWLLVRVERKQEVRFRQVKRGRPGPNTRYRRMVRQRSDLTWEPRSDALAYDEKTDGIFPLITNDGKLSPRKILEAYKLGQPRVEQRHHHLKGVYQVAPQYLKSAARIEAFLCVYFFALLVNALIERETRRAMKRRGRNVLPLYPEGRPCKRPTTEHILKAFEGLMVHRLSGPGRNHHVYEPELTRLQKQVLRLLRIGPRAYRIGRA
ncbi:MAG: IS1634 family transposase, partial [Acidobacteriota bacterium]